MSDLHLLRRLGARALMLAVLLLSAQNIFAGDRILWRNQNDGTVAIWQMDAYNIVAGNLVTNGADGSVLKVVDPSWQIVAWADFDGNGDRDMLWRHSSGIDAIWFVTGSTITSSPLINANQTLNEYVVGAADFDGDGKADILWRNGANFSGGTNRIWKMSGSTVVSTFLLPSVPDENWQVAGLSDFNGDGKADIFWHNSATGQNVLWLMDMATITKIVPVTTVPDVNWTVVQTADFNGDGKSDLLWRHKVTGSLSAWLWDGTTVQQGPLLPTVSDLTWQIVGVRDYDGDGKTDLLWRNFTHGQNSIWLMDGFAAKNTSLIATVPDLAWKIAGDPVTRLLPIGTPAFLTTSKVAGNWQSDFAVAQNPTLNMVGYITESGGTVNGTFHIANSPCLDAATNISLSGALMTNVLFLRGTVGATNIEVVANLDAVGKINSATYTLNGGCVGSLSGTATGTRLPPLTPFTHGSTSSSAGKAVFSGAQISFTQGAAGTDGYSPLSGTSTFGNGGCGIGGALNAAQSFVAGKFVHLEINDATALHVVEGTMDGLASTFTGEYSTFGGACDGDFGTVSISK